MILPSSYFAPIVQYSLLAKQENYHLEAKEHFVKQSYRSRCEIYGANGKLSLVVPLRKWKNNTQIADIKVSYDENWRQLHWKSIESAYRASPYFEFYEEDVQPLFFLEQEGLMERNQAIEKSIKQILNIKSSYQLTEQYQTEQPDFRKNIHPKNKTQNWTVSFPKYIQVFEDKHGFIPNLSILDLLFNLGPASSDYLQTINPLFSNDPNN